MSRPADTEKKPAQKTVLLTGGAGFIGANLVRRLLRDGHTVHLLIRPAHETWRIDDIRCEVLLHEVDLNDAEAVSQVVRNIRPEWIFHLAAHGAYSWQTDTSEIFRTNLNGTIHLVEAALKTGFEAFVHTGTSSEYGFKSHAPGETDWIDPNSHYAVAKAAATHFCRYTARAHNANIVTLRLYSAYGPFEDPGRLMPTLIRRGIAGEWPPLVNPETARDYVYVEDVCEACLLAAQSPSSEPGAVYNVGSGNQMTLREVANVARRILNISAEPPWGSMKGRIWDTSVWVADSRRIRMVLGWQPRFDFESGFQKMVDWHAKSS